MDPFVNQIEIQHAFNHLGMLFLYAPKAQQIYEHYIIPFKAEEVVWPLAIDDPHLLKSYYDEINWDKDVLQEEWCAVLGGPNPLKAPPFSSVYLDPEQVIYGNSYHKFITFLSQHGLVFTLDDHTPEDHIGIMFLALSYLVTEDPLIARILLEEHLLTWSMEYLMQVEVQHQEQSFYRFIAKLAQASLVCVNAHWQLKPTSVVLYSYQQAVTG